MPLNLRSRKRRRTARRPPSAAAIISLRAVLYTLLASGILMIGRAVSNESPQALLPGFATFLAAAILKGRTLRYTEEGPRMIGSLADVLWRRALGKAHAEATLHAIAQIQYEGAFTMEQDLDVIRRAARAEPLDFDRQGSELIDERR